MGRLTLLAMLVGIVVTADPARACSVPVFRYALERWPASPYEVYVFHRGPLSAQDQKVVESLRSAGLGQDADPVVNLRLIDLAAPPVEEAAKMWQRQSSATVPWMVVRYPAEYEIEADAWAGPLTADAVGQVLDSPARRQIAKRILEGEAGVFLILESGDRAKDDAAAELLKTELARLEKTLRLPEPDDGQWDDPVYDEKGPPPLRVAFSALRISRTDPAERMFVRMLLGVAPIPGADSGPVVFPFFGRGRALGAVAGESLNADTIEYIGGFMTGPCSCIVKGQNPGIDMLMAVDWEAALAGQESAIPAVEPPPLAGVSEFVREGSKPQALPLWKGILLGVVGGVAVLAGVSLVVRRVLRSAKN